jgi:AcrR family transcriptional regulator
MPPLENVNDTAPARRAPFSDNPTIGARGLRTQKQILDAALRAFDESGYDRATVDRIAQLVGCSRVTVYQYFSGKDDIFRHLAGHVARQLVASMEALDPVTPDEHGLDALREWVSRYVNIYDRYEPVFRAFGAAAETDAILVDYATNVRARDVARFLARVSTTSFPPRQLESIADILLVAVARAFDHGSILRTGAPEEYTTKRLVDAVAGAVHRALFGRLPGVNEGPGNIASVTVLPVSPALRDMFEDVRALQKESALPTRRGLASLLAVGDDVVVRCGYRGVRVENVVAAADVSHGTFYHYFENIDAFIRVVTIRAVLDVREAFATLPGADDVDALRQWLRRYPSVHATKVAMMRVWMEAVEDSFRDDRGAVVDGIRRLLVPLLAGRDFGDDDADAVVLLAIVEGFGSTGGSSLAVDGAVRIIERGFLGQD